MFSGKTSAGLLSDLATVSAAAVFLKREETSAFAVAIPGILTGQRIQGPGVEGLGSRDIAVRLGVSTKTVDNQRTNLMRKVQAHSVAELIAYAVREGLMGAKPDT